jgi:hypothetical protein
MPGSRPRRSVVMSVSSKADPDGAKGRRGSRAWWPSAAATLIGPARLSTPIARFRKTAMTPGAAPVRTCGSSSAKVVLRMWCTASIAQCPRSRSARRASKLNASTVSRSDKPPSRCSTNHGGHDPRWHAAPADHGEQVREQRIGKQPVTLAVQHRPDRLVPDPALAHRSRATPQVGLLGGRPGGHRPLPDRESHSCDSPRSPINQRTCTLAKHTSHLVY